MNEIFICFSCGTHVSQGEYVEEIVCNKCSDMRQPDATGILVEKEDLDYIWFLMDTEGFYDLLTPRDYKRLHEIKKKYIGGKS